MEIRPEFIKREKIQRTKMPLRHQTKLISLAQKPKMVLSPGNAFDGGPSIMEPSAVWKTPTMPLLPGSL